MRSRTSVRGRDVPGSLLGLTSLQGITGNTQVRPESEQHSKIFRGNQLPCKNTFVIFLILGQKPFKCHLCGRQFSRSDHLSLHMKRH